MPPIETLDLNEYAIVWAVTGRDRYDEPIRDSGTEIQARWEWRRSSAKDPNGDHVTIDATVVVDRDVPCYSLMFQGQLVNFVGTGSNIDDQELVQVVSVKTVPDINAREYRRELGVQKFRGTLPAAR